MLLDQCCKGSLSTFDMVFGNSAPSPPPPHQLSNKWRLLVVSWKLETYPFRVTSNFEGLKKQNKQIAKISLRCPNPKWLPIAFAFELSDNYL